MYGSHILFGINSFVNPFIYAMTIPAFKELVLNYICNPLKMFKILRSREEPMTSQHKIHNKRMMEDNVDKNENTLVN